MIIPVEGLEALFLYFSGTKGLIVNCWISHGFITTFKMLKKIYIYVYFITSNDLLGRRLHSLFFYNTVE